MRSCFYTFVLLSLLLGGCSETVEQSIPTHTATGTVLMPNGQPLPGGMIEFRCLDNTSVTISSIIAEDGTFTLMTMLDNTRVEGAVAGECRVTIAPPLEETDDVQAVGRVFTLAETFEIRPDAENDFTITLP